jgi:HK97 family phage major capsid protein
MTEGTAAQGGYLVRPQVERQIVLARELDNVLRGLCSKLNVTTNSIQLDQLGLSTTAGWVAELAPEARVHRHDAGDRHGVGLHGRWPGDDLQPASR